MLIGIAGIGRMGRPMAMHLGRLGHTVLAYDPGVRTAPAGVRLASRAEDLAETELSLSMLPGRDSTREFVLNGLSNADSTHLHVIIGTVGPELVHELEQSGPVAIADAPVSGSVAMAEAATLTTMVGATSAQFERICPVLAAVTARQFHVGPCGAGSTAKLAVNTVLASLNQAVAEGLMLAEAGGLTAENFYTVLRNSAAGAPYVGYKSEAFLSPDSTPVSAPVSLIRKDLSLALDLARRQRLRLPGAEAAMDQLDTAFGSGLAAEDMAQVLAVLRQENSRTSL